MLHSPIVSGSFLTQTTTMNLNAAWNTESDIFKLDDFARVYIPIINYPINQKHRLN